MKGWRYLKFLRFPHDDFSMYCLRSEESEACSQDLGDECHLDHPVRRGDDRPNGKPNAIFVYTDERRRCGEKFRNTHLIHLSRFLSVVYRTSGDSSLSHRLVRSVEQ
eukprot:451460-Hanusia_phi.AAC.6